MNKALFFLAAALTGAACLGGNITNNGRIYYDVAIITGRCTAAGITFSHKSGIARLDYMEMNEVERTAYGYDAVSYTAFKEEEARLKALPPPVITRPDPPTPAYQTKAPLEARQQTETRIVRRVVVVTNAASPPVNPFGSSPVSTIEPDYNKLNETRLKAVRKAIEINNRAR
jgi:hypothetical protein